MTNNPSSDNLDKIKVLNLYAGIGGNRKLWPNDKIDVTAVEIEPKIAAIYQSFFPNDTVIVADAHQFLLDHYKEFDFIWSSPPCPTHSRMNWLKNMQNTKIKYPDMRLWQEIIFLKEWFKGLFVVENVISYYKPFLKPFESSNHYFWSNFHIEPFSDGKRAVANFNGNEVQRVEFLQQNHNIDLSKYELPNRYKTEILLNCVKPKLGLHIFNMAFKDKQFSLSDNFK